MRTKPPCASPLPFYTVFDPFFQILSAFLIQDLFYFLCQKVIYEDPAYALSHDPTSFKFPDPPIQVQLPRCYQAVNSGYHISTNGSLPEYMVLFQGIGRFLMDLSDFFRIDPGQKIPDCVNFGDLSTDTVPQPFGYALRCGKKRMKTFIRQHQKL